MSVPVFDSITLNFAPGRSLVFRLVNGLPLPDLSPLPLANVKAEYTIGPGKANCSRFHADPSGIDKGAIVMLCCVSLDFCATTIISAPMILYSLNNSMHDTQLMPECSPVPGCTILCRLNASAAALPGEVALSGPRSSVPPPIMASVTKSAPFFLASCASST